MVQHYLGSWLRDQWRRSWMLGWMRMRYGWLFWPGFRNQYHISITIWLLEYCKKSYTAVETPSISSDRKPVLDFFSRTTCGYSPTGRTSQWCWPSTIQQQFEPFVYNLTIRWISPVSWSVTKLGVQKLIISFQSRVVRLLQPSPLFLPYGPLSWLIHKYIQIELWITITPQMLHVFACNSSHCFMQLCLDWVTQPPHGYACMCIV